MKKAFEILCVLTLMLCVGLAASGLYVLLSDSTIFSFGSDTEIAVTNEGELRAAIVHGGMAVVLQNDITLSEPIVITKKGCVLRGNGHALLRATGYTGTMLALEADAELELCDLVLDGEADALRVDMTGAPALVEESLSGLSPADASALISKGRLVAKGVKVVDHYTVTDKQSAIKLLEGSADFTNCEFLHNTAPFRGAAFYIGSEDPTVLTVGMERVSFVGCNFEDNFTKETFGGGAIYVMNAEVMHFSQCNFKRNATMAMSGGGAILFGRDWAYAMMASVTDEDPTNDLSYTKAYFEGCLFDNNHAGNDGFAINSESADLYITDCDFTNNCGYADYGSIGAISCMSFAADEPYYLEYDLLLNRCNFSGNKAGNGVSTVGNHGTMLRFEMIDCTVRNESADLGLLLCSGSSRISGCVFENNQFRTAAVDLRSYCIDPLLLPKLTVSDTAFSDTAYDLVVRRVSGSMTYLTPELTVKGNTVADVVVKDRSVLQIEGALTGDVFYDTGETLLGITVTGQHEGLLEPLL